MQTQRAKQVWGMSHDRQTRAWCAAHARAQAVATVAVPPTPHTPPQSLGERERLGLRRALRLRPL